MSKPKIIIKPKKIVSRKQRKTIVDTSYLIDENKKIHKSTFNELVTYSDTATKPVKNKKPKKEHAGRKKDRKKIREKKRAKRVQGYQDYEKSKKKKHKIPKGIESEPAPKGIESEPAQGEYIPTVDIFDIIEEYIMSIPAFIETWRKGSKGYVLHDMQPFKMSLTSMARDFSMSEVKEIEEYFKNNEYAIKECIDAFTAISTEEDLYTLEERLVNLINMGHALSMDTMNYLELLEY